MKRLIILSIFLHLIAPKLNSQTREIGIVSDINGNVYRTVVVGDQEWMAENLKTTTYNDGIEIPNVIELTRWVELTIGAYCWYNNDSSNAKKYGALYNWYAVNTGKICPVGWRIPSDKDWMQLEAYADSKYEYGDKFWFEVHSRGFDAGKKLKSIKGWDPDCTGTNNFGFKALPGGERVSDLNFLTLGESGFWWTSTPADSNRVWYRRIINCDNGVFRGPHPKFVGFSVRCIKDN
jgi:uncharacterized protein (TIGR02145 family)